MYSSSATALAALVLLVARTTAHSWVEEMDVIDPKTGSFTGTSGYCRNNTKRTVATFSDPLMVHILPSANQPAIEERDTIPALDTTGIYPNDTMCKRTQQAQYQTDGSPRLQAAPGDLVALRYQENGHVTLPQNQPGKQPNRGTVYVYGTTQPASPELFLNVFGQWTEDGSGGDKRGVLLETQPFDDGYCYQVNGGNISSARQAQFPHTPNQLMGANLWCQNNIALPTNIPTGKPYTLYWVWDWPTEPGVDPNLPKGKAELYTTCMDIDIVAKSGSKRRVKARQAPSPPPSPASQSALDHLNSAAIPAYVSSLTASPVPAGASQAVSAQDSPASPYASSLTASPVPASPSPAVPAQVSPSSSESTITPSASASVPASPANPAEQMVGYNSMTNAGEASYIEKAVSAAIAAEAPKVPLTVTIDIVESVISPTAAGAAGAAAATQPAMAPASNPVASPAYVAPASVPAASPASMAPAATQAVSPASASSPPTASTSTPAQAPAKAVSSMPPKSLEINPAILSASPSTSTTVLQGLSGTATPVVASPAAAATSVGASKNPVVASGPATNSTSPVMASASSQNGTVAVKGQRGCSAKTCKSKRQSKIFSK